MVRAYIYLISFKDTNDIYIGKTKHQNIFLRLKQHKADYSGVVCSYVRNVFNGDWSNVYIDIIDSIDMDEDLTTLPNIPKLKDSPSFNYKRYLINNKLSYTELFHIHSFKNDGKYKLINKKNSNAYDVYERYYLYNYEKK